MRTLAILVMAAAAVAGADSKAAEHGQPGAHAAAEHGQPAAHEGAEAAADHGTQEHGNPNEIWWKWANFALLAAGLGYLVKKNAGSFFGGRTAEIRKGIDDAERARATADARMSDIDARLARLSDEIAVLKSAAAEQESVQAARLREETAREIGKVQAHAEREIASAGKAARLELKRHAAELALQLAEKKIEARMTPDVQDELVRGFAQRLPERPS